MEKKGERKLDKSQEDILTRKEAEMKGSHKNCGFWMSQSYCWSLKGLLIVASPNQVAQHLYMYWCLCTELLFLVL